MPSRKVSAHDAVSSSSRAFQAGRTWLNGLISRPIHALNPRKDDVRPSSWRRQAEREAEEWCSALLCSPLLGRCILCACMCCMRCISKIKVHLVHSRGASAPDLRITQNPTVR